MRKTSSSGMSYVVKLRGLPYSVSEQQIEEFFNGKYLVVRLQQNNVNTNTKRQVLLEDLFVHRQSIF